jgi:hypothetical protein
MTVRELLEALKGANPDAGITIARYDSSGDHVDDYSVDLVRPCEGILGGFEITFIDD